MDGEPFLLHNQATLKFPGEGARRSLFYHAGRCLRGTLSLVGLFRHLAIHHGRLGEKSLFQGAANKGSPKSYAKAWELRRIYEFLDSCGRQASFGYVRSAEYPADGISRGRVFTLQELTKGGTCERERRGLVPIR
ncbi:hypothetical protein TcYC6_0024320 [Trypanosoma cruzi]|nr:hypothetical protein TcYC6_0024320 [Trypanosoma cruzi]